MRKKMHSLLVLLMVLMGLIISGCGDEKISVIEIPKEAGQSETVGQSAPIVDIYWDATESMRGYTALQTGLYRTLPDNLGEIASSMGETHFFRFGEAVTPMEGRSYRSFSSPDAYTELVTSFGRVIDEANADHLSIVVTDLFESDADWSNVTQKLREKYFAKHLGVAVIGVKNPFQGDIYDVGVNAAKFSWDSGNETAKFRPFYLFIMGPEQDIKDFLQRWQEHFAGDAGVVEMQYAVFLENLGAEQTSFPDLQVTDSKNLYSNESLEIKDKRVREFGYDSSSNETGLTVTCKYRPMNGACLANMQKLEKVMQVFALDEESGEWKKVDAGQDAPQIEVGPVDGEGNYNATLTFVPDQAISMGHVNFIHARLAPEPRSLKLPPWVKDWNMANIDLDPNAFDGSKTANLQHILESLRDTMLSAAQPALVNINLVINAR